MWSWIEDYGIIWLLVAVGVGFLFAACSCFFAENLKATTLFKSFVFGCCISLPCLWIPCGCLYFCTDKTRCIMCGDKISDFKATSHRQVCLEKNQLVYQKIVDSPLYACQNSDHETPTPLKLWPADKLKYNRTFNYCDKCNDRIENDGSNLHLCFFCDKVLCSQHHPKVTEWQLLVDMQLKSTIPEKPFEFMIKPNIEQPLPSYSTNKYQQLPPYPTQLHTNETLPLSSYSKVQIEDDHQTPTAPLLSTTLNTDIVENYDKIIKSTNNSIPFSSNPTSTSFTVRSTEVLETYTPSKAFQYATSYLNSSPSTSSTTHHPYSGSTPSTT